MAEQSLGLLAVGSEESSGGVRSPKAEQIRSGANTGLLWLAVETALVQLGQGKVLQHSHPCAWPAGKERDISAHPNGQRIKTYVCTGEWKGAPGMRCLLLAKRNEIVVEGRMLECSESSMAGALGWKHSSSCGAQEGHHAVPKFISFIRRGIQSDDYFSLIK